MAKPSRNTDPKSAKGERTYFVTTKTFGARQTLQSDRSANLLIEILFRYRDQGKYRLHDFVVMPDHLHVLITIPLGITIERAAQLIKGGFSFEGGGKFGFKAPVWQPGFSDERVHDLATFLAIRRYIRQNPVKRGLAATAEEYPYSSANPRFHAGAKARSSGKP